MSGMVRAFLIPAGDGDARREASGQASDVRLISWGVLLLREPAGQPRILYPWHRVSRVEIDEDAVDEVAKVIGRRDREDYSGKSR